MLARLPGNKTALLKSENVFVLVDTKIETEFYTTYTLHNTNVTAFCTIDDTDTLHQGSWCPDVMFNLGCDELLKAFFIHICVKYTFRSIISAFFTIQKHMAVLINRAYCWRYYLSF